MTTFRPDDKIRPGGYAHPVRQEYLNDQHA